MTEGTPTGLPAAFGERLRQILPADRFAACWATFGLPAATTFRVNHLHPDSAQVLDELRAAGFQLVLASWSSEVLTVPPEQRRALTETEHFSRGRIYVQNAASMVPARVLGPLPGEWILDLAAAPGSKTLQLAELMDNQGRISAVESVRSRHYRLRRNLEAGGATIVRTYCRDGAGVWRNCPEQFDRVLLDAPCSSEGRFRADEPRTWRYWSRRKIDEMARKQRRLLYSAVQSLKPGGVLVYSTCTFAPEENEVVVDRLLAQFPDSLRVEPAEVPGQVQPGLTAWQGRALNPDLQRAARILPDGLMEAFFVCRMRKEGSTLPATAATPPQASRRRSGRRGRR